MQDSFIYRATAGMLFSAAVVLPSVAAEGVRPNFIIIMSDDMGYGDISCFGNETIHTPNLDRMAAEGMLLTDYHSNGTVSSPTRCALLTGRYQQRAGLDGVLLVGNGKHRKGGLQPDEVTFAEVLSENGYSTALFGKWHVGYLPQFGPMAHGFKYFSGFLAGNVDYKAFVNNEGEYDWWEQDRNVPMEGYLTDVINQKGEEYIEQHKDTPFCLYLAHGCPHSPYQGPDAPSFRIVGEKGLFESGKTGEERDLTYRDMIESLDRGIGAIFDKLRETGLDDRTFVVFVSDNGPVGPGSSGGYRGRKGEVFEGGHRVPGILWMPGVIDAGTRCSVPVMSMDFFPTMLDMAGIYYDDTARPLDGISLCPLMNEEAMPERPLFWRSGNAKAVRQGNWKYIEIRRTGSDRRTDTYLFDLSSDPFEQNNLVKEFPENAKRLQAILVNWEEDVMSETPDQTH